MSATAITPATAGAELLDELRQLLDRHDSASTLDDVREIADELTGVLRRFRGRIGRLTRKAEPKKTETPAEPKPAERGEFPPSRFDPAILGTKTTRETADSSDRTAEAAAPPAVAVRPGHASTAPPPKIAPPRPCAPAPSFPARALEAAPVSPRRVAPPRRITAVRFVLAAAVVLASISAARAGRGLGRLRLAVRQALAAVFTRRGAATPAMPLPRPGDAPPLSATRRSPIDIAAGLQDRKGKAYADYQDAVLQWELGTRAYQSLETWSRPEESAR